MAHDLSFHDYSLIQDLLTYWVLKAGAGLTISRKIGWLEHLRNRLFQPWRIELSTYWCVCHDTLCLITVSILLFSELKPPSPAEIPGPDYTHCIERDAGAVTSLLFHLPNYKFKGRWDVLAAMWHTKDLHWAQNLSHPALNLFAFALGQL